MVYGWLNTKNEIKNENLKEGVQTLLAHINKQRNCKHSCGKKGLKPILKCFQMLQARGKAALDNLDSDRFLEPMEWKDFEGRVEDEGKLEEKVCEDLHNLVITSETVEPIFLSRTNLHLEKRNDVKKLKESNGRLILITKKTKPKKKHIFFVINRKTKSLDENRRGHGKNCIK